MQKGSNLLRIKEIDIPIIKRIRAGDYYLEPKAFF